MTAVVRRRQIPFNIRQQWIRGRFIISDSSHRLWKMYLSSRRSIRLREMEEGGGNGKENTEGRENERTRREEREKLSGQRENKLINK